MPVNITILVMFLAEDGTLQTLLRSDEAGEGLTGEATLRVGQEKSCSSKAVGTRPTTTSIGSKSGW